MTNVDDDVRAAERLLDAFADDAMSKIEQLELTPRREEDRVYLDDPDGLEVQLDSRYGSWPGTPPSDS